MSIDFIAMDTNLLEDKIEDAPMAADNESAGESCAVGGLCGSRVPWCQVLWIVALLAAIFFQIACEAS